MMHKIAKFEFKKLFMQPTVSWQENGEMCPYFTIFYKSLTDETNKVQLVFGQIESGLLKNNPVLLLWEL